MTTQDRPTKVILLGATSAIAEATARLYAAEGAALALVGRNGERLEQIATDLRLRGASRVEVVTDDLALTEDAPGRLAAFAQRIDGADHIVIAYGLLGDQARAEEDFAHAAEIIHTNFTSVAAWCLAAAALLERQGSGALAALGSVAGDRGRRSNCVHGAAKAGTATLVAGLAHRFARRGPRAVVIKVGPTDTPMTAGMAKGALWSTPEQIARVVRAAADRGGTVVYAPWFWRWASLLIRMTPSPIFNRLNV